VPKIEANKHLLNGNFDLKTALAYPINKTTSKTIVRTFNSFLPPYQKECSRNRPIESTSAAGLRQCLRCVSSMSAACQHGRGRIGIGYIKKQWAHKPDWVFYQQFDSQWFDLPAVRVKDIEPQVYLIPAYGHTIGHCMIAVQNGDHWLLHCGDSAYPFYLQKEEQIFKPLDSFVTGVLGLHIKTLRKLIENYGDQITLISSLDSVSLEKNKKLELL